MPFVLNPPSEIITQVKAISKRIDVIDAMRGFALFGIILTHCCNLFANFPSEAGNLNTIDSIINTVIGFLFRGRAFLIFSFLFGLSFAIQIQSAKAKNKPFISRFIWRLAILSVIGYFHRLIYSAEILQIYALLGLALVLCINLKNHWLLIVSMLLYLASIVVKFYNFSLINELAPLALTIKKSALYQFIGVYKIENQIETGRAFITLSLFILGLYAGRKNIFSDTVENRIIFKKALIWSTVAIITTTLGYTLIKYTGAISENLLKAVHNSTQITQAFFYVAVIENFYRVKYIHQVLQWLVPMGRMGLTIYILQSIFLTQFFGLGVNFITGLGLTAAIGITIAFFIGQVLFAYWWMSNFLFGPVEWLWRVLINFKLEPIKRKIQPQPAM